MGNRYGSIMERITAQQEVEDREDGDAIRREYSNEQNEKRISGIIDGLSREDFQDYMDQALQGERVYDRVYSLLRLKVADAFPEDC